MTKTKIIKKILQEVERAQNKFPTWPDDIIHANNILQEEAGELTKTINEFVYEYPKSVGEDVEEEAIQTGAMVFRFLLSLEKYTFNKSEEHTQ